ncbi:MAG: hypothetical protein IPI35_07910 [Deltaproteobacteria bacterium]|nr:hypothetical protein [Deltaproteobacteria bacterium]
MKHDFRVRAMDANLCIVSTASAHPETLGVLIRHVVKSVWEEISGARLDSDDVMLTHQKEPILFIILDGFDEVEMSDLQRDGFVESYCEDIQLQEAYTPCHSAGVIPRRMRTGVEHFEILPFSFDQQKRMA